MDESISKFIKKGLEGQNVEFIHFGEPIKGVIKEVIVEVEYRETIISFKMENGDLHESVEENKVTII